MTAMPSQWSPQQERALSAVREWLKAKDQPVFRLFGYAGTGKTTLARELASNVKGQVLFGAFTGKAAHVLQQKGCSSASTIHSMVYEVKQRNDGVREFRKKSKKEFENIKLIVIDECSMVDEEIGKDLLSFGVPVLVLGDPAQLPPIKGQGFFTDCKPDFMLEEIHRQAADNPIIRLSMLVRQGERPITGDHGNGVKVCSRNDINSKQVLQADQILVGMNVTRHRYNNRLRELLGRDGEVPVLGDRLVCLKNNRDEGLFNGSLWTVSKIKNMATGSHRIWVKSEDTDAVVDCDVLDACWDGSIKDVDWKAKRGFDEFTYGYALTVHKSQGSQWNNVMIFDESGSFGTERSRWLYTAVTRAAQHLTLVI